MKWISSILGKEKEEGLKLKFSKKNNAWMVTRKNDIVFIGEENQCRIYMSNFQDSK